MLQNWDFCYCSFQSYCIPPGSVHNVGNPVLDSLGFRNDGIYGPRFVSCFPPRFKQSKTATALHSAIIQWCVHLNGLPSSFS